MTTENSTAIHEAGHALTAWYYEWLSDDHKISIDPGEDDDWAGICESDNPFLHHEFDVRYGSDRNYLELAASGADVEREYLEDERKLALYRHEAEQQVVVLLAGGEAGLIHDPDASRDGCGSDYKHAREIIEQLIESRGEPGDPEAQLESYWAWLRKRASSLLEWYWDAVLAIAELLEKHGTISGAEASKAIRAVLASRLADSLQAPIKADEG